uniref:DNA mismatch repair proteins mutS family domain-containing protein n=1 Tax=viral metagenome TaxID=1070528 RepID=A0A6C0ADA5_9ZZZZ
MTIHDEYIYYQNKYEQQYGKKTLVLMQVGSFHECYSLGDIGPDLAKISDLCDLTLTKRDKKKPLSQKNPYLIGFPTVALDKYIKKLIIDGYTVPVFDQVTPPPDPKRELTGVYSPGTYIEENLTSESNNIMSIYIEDEPQIKDNNFLICIGISVIDVSTGKTTIYEIVSEKTDRNLACDEAVRFINSFSPKEIIVNRKSILKVDKLNYQSKEDIINYLELNDKNYNYSTKIDKKWFKSSIKETFLKKIYKTTGLYDTVIEYLDLERKPYCTMSLVILLEFVFNHNSNLLNKINKPEYFDGHKHLILGNNAINQLNIARSDISSASFSKFKSLYDVVNNCYTPLGKRFLKARLCNPITDIDELNYTYSNIDIIKNNYLDILTEKISGIIDVERLFRKINVGTIHPHEFNEFIKSYKKIRELFNAVLKIDKLNIIKDEDYKQLDDFIKYCDRLFDYNKLEMYKITDIDTSLFQKGHHKKIDNIQNKIDDYINYMKNITVVLSSYIQDTKKKDDSLKIKLEHNNSEGYFLKTTKKRADSLKKELEKHKLIKITDKINLDPRIIFYKDLKGGTTKIVYRDLDEISDETITLKDSITKLVFDEYKKELNNMSEKYSILFRYISDTLAYIDFCISSAKTAKLYNYTKPKIVDKTYGYIKTTNLRHPIIERITEAEYVPHDIDIGSKSKSSIDGMLIFGLNSAGKSSLMKATGLSVVMAQSGMFVPAKSFEYSPFNSLFARITGNDNIFKGLSSFALEMVELEAILKRISQKTLVIGDEVCRGTETISGNAIVASTIVELAKNKTPFMFATHLHKIPEIEEVKSQKNVKCFHLTVETEPKTGKLIFDRKLKDGPGENIYGIKVAKHIINHSSFIKRAEQIRDRLSHKPDIITDKVSKYNSKIVMDCCQVCGKKVKSKYEIPLDTHHINYQTNCKNGFVKDKPHIPINSKANLAVLCKSCHNKEHKGTIKIKGYKKTSCGIELDYDLITTKKL